MKWLQVSKQCGNLLKFLFTKMIQRMTFSIIIFGVCWKLTRGLFANINWLLRRVFVFENVSRFLESEALGGVVGRRDAAVRNETSAGILAFRPSPHFHSVQSYLTHYRDAKKSNSQPKCLRDFFKLKECVYYVVCEW